MARKTIVGILLVLFMAGVTYAQEAIQTQTSSDGKTEAAIIGAKVRKEILTIKIEIKNISDKNEKIKFRYANIYLTDLNQKKKYFILKDTEGQYIAGPKSDSNSGGRFWETLPVGDKRTVWLKFPAPPETTKNVDLFLPKILPFEDVPLKR